MSYNKELQCLTRYIAIPEINACLELAYTAKLTSNPIPTEIEKLRGELLRTTETLRKYNPKSWSALKSVYVGFTNLFFLPCTPNHFKQVNNYQYNEIEMNLKKLLHQLALAYPTNENDLIDLEPLPSNFDERFITLHGCHYRLNNLVEWVRHAGQFTYPDTNKAMDAFDRIALTNQCETLGLSLQPYPKHLDIFNEVLSQVRLTFEDIDTLNVPYYHENHFLALVFLIKNHQYTLQNAIAEIQGLHGEQVSALMNLFHLGLRGDHLRNLDIEDDDFTAHHEAVIQILIEKYDFSLEEALAYVSNRSMDEVQEVYSWPSQNRVC
jgi:hypothetical protein